MTKANQFEEECKSRGEELHAEMWSAYESYINASPQLSFRDY